MIGQPDKTPLFEKPRKELKLLARQLLKENQAFRADRMVRMTDITKQQAASSVPLIEIWRSRDFTVQVFQEKNGIERLTINRTAIDVENRRWIDGITWDQLQWIKRSVGYGEYDALEAFPSDHDIVNVANMRHLWVLPIDKAAPFFWRNPGPRPVVQIKLAEAEVEKGEAGPRDRPDGDDPKAGAWTSGPF